jgi:hypothetical protein
MNKSPGSKNTAHSGEYYAYRAIEAGKSVEDLPNGRIKITNDDPDGTSINIPHGMMGYRQERHVSKILKWMGVILLILVICAVSAGVLQ